MNRFECNLWVLHKPVNISMLVRVREVMLEWVCDNQRERDILFARRKIERQTYITIDQEKIKLGRDEQERSEEKDGRRKEGNV